MNFWSVKKMKTKIYIGIAIVVLISIIVATVVISRPFIIKYELNRIAKAEEEKAEVIKDNTVSVVVVDPVDVDSLKAVIRKEMQKEFDVSHQNPEKNEEYDKQVNENVEFLADDLPKAFEDILNRTKKVVSMEYTYKDNRIKGGYKAKMLISYHYPHKKEPPRFEVEVLDIDYSAKIRLKFDIMAYIGYNSLSVSFGYEPFRWLRVGTILNGQKILLDGSEKILINPLIGVGVKF